MTESNRKLQTYKKCIKKTMLLDENGMLKNSFYLWHVICYKRRVIMKYTNPVIKGFYPVPSVCFANGKYYLVLR